MAQTGVLIFSRNMAWMLLEVAGFTVVYLAVRKFVVACRLPLSRLDGKSRNQGVSLCDLATPASVLIGF